MHFPRVGRRVFFVLAIAGLVAGCATPQESGPADLSTDKDGDGIPDNIARELENLTANASRPTPEPTPEI